jgi:hypothetical protein
LPAQTAEGQKSRAELPNSRQYAQSRKNKKNSYAPGGHETKLAVHHEKQQVHQGDQSKRPENRAEKNSPPERMQPIHGWAFMR